MSKISIVSEKDKRVITLQDLKDLHWISDKLWETIKQTANVWEQAQNKKDWTTEIIQLHQIKADFKPITGLVNYMDELERLFKGKAPVQKWPTYKDWPLLWQIVHTDIHFDRIQHKGKNYLKEIDDRTMKLFELLLKHKPDKLIYANLWDYWNSDVDHKTTRGTPQHDLYSDRESFKIWLEHQRNLIKALSSEIPVDVIYIPWNHDTIRLQALSDAMHLYFSATNNVTVDREPMSRKYMRRWNTTLARQHGDGIKTKQIPLTMMQETKLGKHNYMYQWHVHKKMKEEYGNIIIETLWSPAWASEWEAGNWRTQRGKIESQLFDKYKWKIAEFIQ